jgi:hypothetical protein
MDRSGFTSPVAVAPSKAVYLAIWDLYAMTIMTFWGHGKQRTEGSKFWMKGFL